METVSVLKKYRFFDISNDFTTKHHLAAEAATTTRTTGNANSSAAIKTANIENFSDSPNAVNSNQANSTLPAKIAAGYSLQRAENKSSNKTDSRQRLLSVRSIAAASRNNSKNNSSPKLRRFFQPLNLVNLNTATTETCSHNKNANSYFNNNSNNNLSGENTTSAIELKPYRYSEQHLILMPGSKIMRSRPINKTKTYPSTNNTSLQIIKSSRQATTGKFFLLFF